MIIIRVYFLLLEVPLTAVTVLLNGLSVVPPLIVIVILFVVLLIFLDLSATTIYSFNGPLLLSFLLLFVIVMF